MDFTKYKDIDLSKYKSNKESKTELMGYINEVINNEETKFFNPRNNRTTNYEIDLYVSKHLKKYGIIPLDDFYFSKKYVNGNNQKYKCHICLDLNDGLKKIYYYDCYYRNLKCLDLNSPFSRIKMAFEKYVLNGVNGNEIRRKVKDGFNFHYNTFGTHKYVITESDSKYWFFKVKEYSENNLLVQFNAVSNNMNKLNGFMSMNSNAPYSINYKTLSGLENNGLITFNKNNNKCIFKSNDAKEFSNIMNTIILESMKKTAMNTVNKFMSN